MRSVLLSLVFAVFILQGCEGPEETTSETSNGSEESSASTLVAYDFDAEGSILKKLQSCVRNEVGAINDVGMTEGEGDWEIRIVARDSRDFSVYCESLITLSTVILQPASAPKGEEGGKDLYVLHDHQATTFQSEKLGSVCESIMEDFADILEKEGK